YAQHPLRILVKDAKTGQPLIGASVFIQGTPLNGQTNPEGEIRLRNLKKGDFTVRVSYLGYDTKRMAIEVPHNELVEIHLQPASFLADEVIVQATRASSN